MSEDDSGQTSLDEIVNEHSEADSINEDTGDGEEPTVESGRIETSIGILPADWDVERLSEICEINPDGFSEDDWENETFEYISLSEVSEGEILRSETVPLDEAPSRAQREIKAGDVLVGTVRPKQVSHGFVTEEHDGKICSSGFGVLRTGENLNGLYLLQEILSHRFFRQMEAYVAGSGYPAVKIGDLEKHRIGIPSLPEQRKIASVLYNVDEAIQKAEEIIKQTRRVKRGTMQDLFTEGYYDHDEFVDTKIGEMPTSWNVDKVKNHTELISGAHVKSDLVSEDDSLTPYLTGPDDFDEFGFTISKYTDEPTKFCEPNDTLVTVKGSGCGKSTFANQRACISRQLKALRPIDGLEPLYLFYFMKTKQNYLETLSEGSAIPGLSNSHLKAIDIPVPSVEEQQKIAETLREFDEQIETGNEYKSQLERLKQSVMQDLLTGEVRTADRDINVLPEVKNDE